LDKEEEESEDKDKDGNEKKDIKENKKKRRKKLKKMMKKRKKLNKILFIDWGLGIGPNPQSPILNPQSPSKIYKFYNFNNQILIKSLITH
jgi:hypothetical protein